MGNEEIRFFISLDWSIDYVLNLMINSSREYNEEDIYFKKLNIKRNVLVEVIWIWKMKISKYETIKQIVLWNHEDNY